MNSMRFALVLMLFCAPAFAADGPAPNLSDLAKQLGEGTSSAKTAAEFEEAYTKALPPLLTKPEGDDSVLQKIAFRASRPGAEIERAALGKVLAERLSAGGAV